MTWIGHQYRGQIYGMQWGWEVCASAEGSDEEQEQKKSKLMLFSIGDSKIFMHDPLESKSSVNLEKIITATNGISRAEQKYSELSFHPDFRVLATGSDDGTIEILKLPHLQLLCTVKSQQKLIQNLKWHPSVNASGNDSKYKSWLAVGSNETDVHVFDLRKIVDGEEKIPILTTPTVSLKGHFLRVIMVDWSPHEEGKLASVSYDASTQVINYRSPTITGVGTMSDGRFLF